MPEQTILFCPGIGANGDMFEPIIEELHRGGVKFKSIFLDFPAPLSRKESMESYTARAFRAPEIKNIKFNIAVGCSFGGMLLQEAIKQKLISPARTVLICTALCGKDINSFVYFMIPLTYLIPRFLFRPLQLFIATMYPIMRYKRPWARKFSKMFRQTNPDVFFIAPRMIRFWNADQNDIPTLPRNILQFHGTSDPLISYKKVSAKRILEFPLYKKNHIIFATEVEFIAGEIYKLLKAITR